MSEISTILGLLADNVGWVLINIVVPVILPPAGLLLARLMPLQRAERERTRIVQQFSFQTKRERNNC